MKMLLVLVVLTVFSFSTLAGPVFDESQVELFDGNPLTKSLNHLEENDPHAKKDEMNDIPFSLIKDYKDNLKIVSTRFRRDKKEFRVVYVNSIAAESINTKERQFKDQSLFLKVVYKATKDPKFPDSIMPNAEVDRYQIMLKDNKKYKDTRGWGYALFRNNGKTFPGNPSEATIACATCHEIVPERGYVFTYDFGSSLPSDNDDNTSNVKEITPSLNKKSLISYKIVERKQVPDFILKYLGSNKSKKFIKFSSEILNQDFIGSFTGIWPSMIHVLKENDLPSFALSEKSNDFFSYAQVIKKQTQCQKGEKLINYAVGKTNKSATTILEKNSCF